MLDDGGVHLSDSLKVVNSKCNCTKKSYKHNRNQQNIIIFLKLLFAVVSVAVLLNNLKGNNFQNCSENSCMKSE